MGVNKVILNDPKKGEEVVVDLTGATMKPENLDEGVTGWDAEGNLIKGTRKAGEITILGTGSCGDNAIWTVYSDGKLVVSGSGKTTGYRPSDSREWKNFAEDVTEIIIGEGITRIGSYIFDGFANVSNVIISEGVTYIDPYAFGGCESLKSVTIPNSVGTIDAGFKGCDNLEMVFYLGTKNEWDAVRIGTNSPIHKATLYCEFGILGTGSCGENAIWTAYGDGRFVVSGTGSTVDVAYKDVTNTEWYDIRNDINTIIVENGITRLGEYLFCDFAEVVSVNIPESVMEIGDRCFSYCTKLPEVVLPSGLNYLGNYALDSCISLRYVVIPEGITDLLAGVFQGCKGLESVVLPKGLTKIAYQNFRHCSKLAYVYFSGTKAEWDSIEISYNGEDDNKYLFTATLCCEYDPNADTVDGWHVDVRSDDSDPEGITKPTLTFYYEVG
jgi:hypothetical protein